MDSKLWLQNASKLLPAGHTITMAGVLRGKHVVTSTPVVVDAKLMQESGQVGYLRLSWLAVGSDSMFREMKCCIPVSEVVSGKWQWGLEMAQRGIDAGNHNFKDLASYFMAASLKAPSFRGTGRTGWTKDEGFVLPHIGIDRKGREVSMDLLGELNPEATYIGRAGRTPAFAFHGSLDGWMKAVTLACQYSPRASLAIYGSLLAPLLANLGTTPFAIMWSGKSGCGKGTALALAASVWGKPDLDEYILAWSQLPQPHLADLPLCLDNLLLSDMRSTCAKIQEALLGGHNSMILASGIDTIEDLVGEETLKSRLLRLWGRPFIHSVTVQHLAELRASLDEHHGTFGEEFLRRLMRRRDKFPIWFEDWAQEERKKWRVGCAEMPEYVQGLASHCADLVTTSRIVQALFPGFLDPDALALELSRFIRTEGSRKRTLVQAAISVKEHVAGNLHRVYDPRITNIQPPPSNGWIGRYDQEGRVWILETVVDRLLLSDGVNPREIKGEWIALGGLVITAANRSYNTLPIGGSASQGRYIAFKPDFPASLKKA